MTEREAWDVLGSFARKVGTRISPDMPINQLRRELAKTYQPRLATDDGSAMMRINPAIDVIEVERDRRELLGIRDPADRQEPRRTDIVDPWRTGPKESTYGSEEWIQKTVYERAAKFGKVDLVKAWAWDGHRFRKVMSANANQWAYEELGRGLLKFLVERNVSYPCEGIFLTKGEERARNFRLILIKIGKGYYNVTSYDLQIDLEPDDPCLGELLTDWLSDVRQRLYEE